MGAMALEGQRTRAAAAFEQAIERVAIPDGSRRAGHRAGTHAAPTHAPRPWTPPLPMLQPRCRTLAGNGAGRRPCATPFDRRFRADRFAAAIRRLADSIERAPLRGAAAGAVFAPRARAA
jgi:hypothetical protein